MGKHQSNELKPQLQTEQHSVKSQPVSKAPGGAYTEIPDFSKSTKPNPLQYLLIAALLTGGCLGVYKGLAAGGSRIPASVVAGIEEKALKISPADVDQEATAWAREEISQGKVPDLLQARVKDTKKKQVLPQPEKLKSEPLLERPPPAAEPEKVSFIPAPENLRTVAKATPEMIKMIERGDMKFYSFNILDFADEDGDAVEVSVDGALLGFVQISNSGLTISVPLIEGQARTLTVRAVRDGYGGVTFGVQLQNSQVILKPMAVGESAVIPLRFVP